MVRFFTQFVFATSFYFDFQFKNNTTLVRHAARHEGQVVQVVQTDWRVIPR